MAQLGLITNEFLPVAGGIGTYARELARAATDLGHQVILLAPSFARDNRQLDAEQPFEVLRYPGTGASLRDYPRLLPSVLAFARRAELDLLHACDSSSLAALGITQPIHGRDFVATIHGSDVSRAAGGVYGRVARLAGFYTRPRLIFANSHYTRQLLLRNCPGVETDRARVTPLGVDGFWFQASGSVSELQALGIRDDERLVVCVARLTARKGQLAAVEAYARLPASVRSGTRLLLIGHAGAADAAYFHELERAVQRHAPGVVLTGKLSSPVVRALYARAAVFLLPGGSDGPWVEGFGLVFLEAAAQGLPALAGRQGGVPEAVEHGQTGLLVKPDDAAELSAALEMLLRDEALRARLGAQARARAATFTWRRCALATYGSA